MKYPELVNTPIKEIVFSISFNEIIDEECFSKFLKINKIKERFKDVKPSIDNKLKIVKDEVDFSSIADGFHLKNDSEVLQLRKGSFSFHYLSGYKKFIPLLNIFCKYWNQFNNVVKDNLTILNYSIRYINVIEIDDGNLPTHLVQLYPKQSIDRNILNFQNSIRFSYSDEPKYIVNAVSTKVNFKKEEGVLLDISVISNEILQSNETNIKEIFIPLQELKNKTFFDSITTRTLIKYSKKNN